jgi:hypothetical protein
MLCADIKELEFNWTWCAKAALKFTGAWEEHAYILIVI